MPELIKPKTSIVGRSPNGNAVVCFDDETSARRWIQKITEDKKQFSVKFFKQTITEEEIEIKL